MQAGAILQKIDENAKNLSSEILKEANAKAQQIQLDSHQRIAQLKEETQLKASQEINQMRKQMESVSELEFKKEILAQKRTLIYKAFNLAKEKLQSLPTQTIREKVVAMILSSAQEGSTLYVGEHSNQWFNQDVLNQLNTQLQSMGKSALLYNSQQVPCCTGAVLVKDGIETNCTLEAILEYIRSDIENDVATKLFQNKF